MGNSDKNHFEEYNYQNRVKHEIFLKYFATYAVIIIHAWNTEIVLIDGFAGRGHYGDPDKPNAVPGSPLRALQTIANNPLLSKKVHTWFIEKDKDHFQNLESSINSFVKVNKGVIKPILTNDAFVNAVQPELDAIEAKGMGIKPTFLFVDPCGIMGVGLNTICQILEKPRCELLLFFNYDGVQRTMGLLKTDRKTPSLVEIFGTTERVEKLSKIANSDSDPREKELQIISEYLDALRSQSKADFLIPFRVEYEQRASTSHYLIHASKHPLAFTRMKDIMWEASRTAASEGRLELLQKSKDSMHDLLRSDLAEIDLSILEHLDTVDCENVDTFREEWPKRPTDLYSSRCYYRRLLELERLGKIEVLDDDKTTPLLPDTRRQQTDKKTKKKGPTLAGRLYVRKTAS